jgi:hypothetical protein
MCLLLLLLLLLSWWRPFDDDMLMKLKWSDLAIGAVRICIEWKWNAEAASRQDKANKSSHNKRRKHKVLRIQKSLQRNEMNESKNEDADEGRLARFVLLIRRIVSWLSCIADTTG